MNSSLIAQTAHETYLKNAERGDVEAIRYMSFVNFVDGNYSEAFSWNKKGAILGDGSSQNSLGRCYEDGKGVAKDIDQAVKWYVKSADNNCPLGITSLADCYAEGKGVKLDEQKAKDLYYKSINLGEFRAKGGLARLLLIEECDKINAGKETDFSEVLKLARDAAEMNERRGLTTLGVCYHSAYGVPQDYAKAIQFYEKVAEMGRRGVLLSLADCYFKLGERDIAYKWYNIAEGVGDSETSKKAAAEKASIARYLTGSQIGDAQEKSRLWVEKFMSAPEQN